MYINLSGWKEYVRMAVDVFMEMRGEFSRVKKLKIDKILKCLKVTLNRSSNSFLFMTIKIRILVKWRIY